jgi:gamma-glutamylputrescine oxidase
MKKSVFWFDASPPRHLPPLTEAIETDALVVGGGTAGLSAAQWLREEAGLDVVLLEADSCGTGATGQSAGLLNVDTELDSHQYTRRFGDRDGGFLWKSGMAGIHKIRDNIERLQLSCGFIEADSLYVGKSWFDTFEIRGEHATRLRLGLPSTYYNARDIRSVLGSSKFQCGVRYGGTFGMDALAYAQELRDALRGMGVRVYEQTPVTEIRPDGVATRGGSVRAKYVVLCVDRFAPELGIETPDVYHQQNFMVVSEPLPESVWREIMPQGPLLVHDAHTVYHYFRPTPDGRLVLGGGLQRTAYDHQPADPEQGARHLLDFIRQAFPVLEEAEFSHCWPGLFGLSQDMIPVAGKLPQRERTSSTQFGVALMGGGMTWSLLGGRCAAQAVVEGQTPYDRFFAPRRAFTPLEPWLEFLSKPLRFRLSHLYTKTLLTGTGAQIARQQRRWQRGALAVGALALASGAWWLAHQRHRDDRSLQNADSHQRFR